MSFRPYEFLPASLLARITDIRVSDPDRALQAAKRRQRRKQLTLDGKLNLLAADHPARRVTRVGDDPLAMANRHDYLARVVRVLSNDAVDGVMATMDLLEELLLLHDLCEHAGGEGFLHRKALIASLNRGGLAGAQWEMDDPLTGASPQSCKEWDLDGAKLLLRVCDEDPGSLKTLLACADCITQLNALGLPTFLEPLPVVRANEGYQVIKEADALTRLVGVASALGDSSRYLWLKLPYCDRYERVAGATTLPVLLLGGEAVGDAKRLLEHIAAGMAAGANVRGTLIGRNVLYPGQEDPLVVAAAVHGIVHQGWTAQQAMEAADEHRGQNLDYFNLNFSDEKRK